MGTIQRICPGQCNLLTIIYMGVGNNFHGNESNNDHAFQRSVPCDIVFLIIYIYIYIYIYKMNS